MEAIGNYSIMNLKDTTTMKKQYSGRKGLKYFKNIQDRSTLEKHVKRARDPISITTKNEQPSETNSIQTKSPVGSSNVIDILDMDKQFK